MLTEDRLAAITALFQDAALGRADWQQGVEAYTEALDIAHGQLIAFGRESLVTLNVTTGEALIELESFGGHSPLVNSRVRIGSRAAELQFLDERNFTTEWDAQANPQYGDWLQRHDVGYSCVTPLLRHGGILVGLAGLSTRSSDAMGSDGRRGFMAIAANIRSAVNLALAVEEQKATTLAAALGNGAMAVLVCDGGGRIKALSPHAERLILDGGFGRLSGEVFTPFRPAERDRFNRLLADAIASSLSPASPPPRPMVLTAADGQKAVAEFVPLPKDTGFTFTASVLVLLRGGEGTAHRGAEIARELFALTAAETRVAARLLDGRSPQDIASESATSVGTVRNHVHRILSKAHCKSQVEFLALMRRYA